MANRTKPLVFISYAHKNKRRAVRLAQDLEKAEISYWIDRERLEKGDPLLDKIQQVLKQIRFLALLWSRAASKSRYVKSEWQAAYHLKKAIIPCALDGTEMPPFLQPLIFSDFRRSYAEGFAALLSAIQGRAKALPKPVPRRLPAALVADVVQQMTNLQFLAIQTLVQSGPAAARAIQDRLAPLMKKTLAKAGQDADILNLAGYHAKNAYMIKHWQAIQARKARPDPLLQKSESFFHSSLAIRPNNASALNGLGSILILRRDLDAAEFFVRRALDQARKEGIQYDAAEEDLRTILRLKQEKQP